jgi:polysaccharide chain length determinant protein (PEP-CTERM system associated)
MKDFRNLSPADYLQIFWRRKWYFVAVLILVSAAGAGYAYIKPPVYRSDTRILVQETSVPSDYVRPMVEQSAQDKLNAIRLQLESRSFLERVIQEMQLFGYGSEPGFNMEDAVRGLRQGISVSSSAGGVITLSFTAADPQFARDVTRRLATSLIQINLASRKNLTLGTDQFIDEQLREAKRDLEAHSEKIREFKERHLGELPEQSAANLNALSGLNARMARINDDVQRAQDQIKLLKFRSQEQQRLAILTQNLLPAENTRATASKTESPPDPLAAQLAERKARLAEALARYTPQHPDVLKLSREVEQIERQIAERQAAASQVAEELTPLGETKKEPAAAAAGEPAAAQGLPFIEIADAELKLEEANLRNQIANLEKERKEVQRQIDVYQARLNMAPALEQEFLTISREHDVLQRRYSDLQSKKFSAEMATALENTADNETYKILDEANLPIRPVFPNRLQILLMGVGAGFIMGIAAAFGREYLDPTISREEDALPLGLPVLVSIPELPAKEPRRRKLAPARTLPI